MKYYAKCSTINCDITLAMTAATKEQAEENLHKTYQILEVLEIQSAEEYSFISQREQFKSIPMTYRKDRKSVGTGNF
jgi:hypothetical protein